MKKSQQSLIKFWLEIGKIKRQRSVPDDPASQWQYTFVTDDGIELELRESWTHFFKVMDTFNHLYFMSGIEGVEVPYDVDVTEVLIPFDPWSNPHFISMEFNADFMSEVFNSSKGRQIYQCIEVFKSENR